MSASGPEAGTKQDTHTILLVDDEPSVLRALRRIFREDGYTVLTAEDASQAFDVLAKSRVALVISDHRMPGITGTEFLTKVRERDPNTIRILLTGASDHKAVMTAIDDGVLYKYITKPWDDNELRITIRLALSQYDLIRENSQLKQRAGKQQHELRQFKSFLSTNSSPLGALLVQRGIILPAQLEMVQKYCAQNNVVLFRAMVELGMASEQDMFRMIQEESQVEVCSVEPAKMDKSLAQIVPQDVCRSGCLVPLAQEGNTLILAMADVLDLHRIDYVRFTSGLTIRSRLALWSELQAGIQHLYDTTEPDSAESETAGLPDGEDVDIAVTVDLDDLETDSQLVARSNSHSAVKLVNAIFSRAVNLGASDIHIEPKEGNTIVRYRVDGLLQDGMSIPGHLHLAAISRLKILAKMDISVRRIPQDGRIAIKSGERHIDVRVSTMPTVNGEKAVCRLLDRNASIKKMSDIGLHGESLRRLEKIISVPQGIIIATGPTGSGKTTTLYSLLNERVSKTLNCVTIEDPVEYLLGEASQVHVYDKIGLTFASTLRCTLRQDPDVILVGEIRDLETAQAAFQAAATGHLVFTSLHTNSSVGAVTRLIHLGIQPYLVASTLQGILAQRLVRKICPACRQLVSYDRKLVDSLGLSQSAFPAELYYGKGCDACGHTGYHGRLGLFEVFHMNESFREVLTSTYDESHLTNLAVSLGMTTLLADAQQKVLDGLTTLDEIVRVLGPALKFNYQCVECGQQLEHQYSTCPFCGKEQRRTCHVCHSRLEKEWIACAFCGSRPAHE